MYFSSSAMRSASFLWLAILGLSGYMMISSMLKMAAALPIWPIFEVFSRRWGVSEMTDVGMAIDFFFFSMFCASFRGKNLCGLR